MAMYKKTMGKKTGSGSMKDEMGGKEDKKMMLKEMMMKKKMVSKRAPTKK